MIKLVEGDILEAKEEVLIHQVNCQGKFAKGLAWDIRQKYDIAYKDYIQCVEKNTKNKKGLLGNVLITQVEENKFVAHVFGQEFYGKDKQYTSYPALKRGLITVREKAKLHRKSLSIPYGIGCGNGGGDWNDIFPMIQSVFHDYPITIYRKLPKEEK